MKDFEGTRILELGFPAAVQGDHTSGVIPNSLVARHFSVKVLKTKL